MIVFYVIMIVNILLGIYNVSCTIDINISELEYLAAHLSEFECHQLVAALHYTTYELPQSISGAMRKVDENIPCIRQLLHWNSSPSEGRGKTHEDMEHRLRQINRKDLADWLGKTVFRELGNDIIKSLERPFGQLGDQENETQYPITLDPLDEIEKEEEDPWNKLDTFLMAFLGGLLICLGFSIVSFAIRKIKVQLTKKNDPSIKTNKSRTQRKFNEDEGPLLVSTESD